MSHIPTVIDFVRLHTSATVPTRATDHSAGFDLYARESVQLFPGYVMPVGTGIAVGMQRGWLAMLFERSGMAKFSVGLMNGVGVIDSDYRGEILAMCWVKDAPYTINKGDRFAQLVFQRLPSVTMREVASLSPTSRGAGGFGSTGV